MRGLHVDVLRSAAASIVLTIGLAASSASAEEMTMAKAMICRDTPTPSGRTVATLKAGDIAALADRIGGWAELGLSSGQRCWVFDGVAGSASSPQGLSVTAEPPQQARPPDRAARSTAPARRVTPRVNLHVHTPVRPASRAVAARSRPRPAPGGACPCSGRSVCVGPRGGRYCITSGGNKRYGV